MPRVFGWLGAVGGVFGELRSFAPSVGAASSAESLTWMRILDGLVIALSVLLIWRNTRLSPLVSVGVTALGSVLVTLATIAAEIDTAAGAIYLLGPAFMAVFVLDGRLAHLTMGIASGCAVVLLLVGHDLGRDLPRVAFVVAFIVLGGQFVLTGRARRDELISALDVLASTDELTGLANRRALIAEADRWLAEQAVGLIIVDIDFFKSINDLNGHPVGDEVLRSVGRCLALAVPGSRICGRLGGDEFAIVCRSATAARLDELTDSIKTCLRNTPVRIDDAHFRVTVSVGAAVGLMGSTFADLYPVVDRELYRNKSRRLDPLRADTDLWK